MAKTKATKLNPKFPESDNLRVPANVSDISAFGEGHLGVFSSAFQSAMPEDGNPRRFADFAKQHAEKFFIDVTDDCDRGIQDNFTYSIEAPSIGCRFFRFRDPRYNSAHSSEQKWLLSALRWWEHQEKAISVEQDGDLIKALGHLEMAKSYKTQLYSGLDQMYAAMDEQLVDIMKQLRAKIPEYSKHLKRERRVQRATELIKSGEAATPWKASFIIENDKDEKSKQRTIYQAIKHLNKKRSSET